MKPTTVIINICTYKRPEMLSKCLASIYRQEIPDDWDLAVIIIDNDGDGHMSDSLKAMVNYNPISIYYINEQQQGIPYARNRACHESLERGADWIIFIDDDEEADPGWLISYAEAIKTFQANVYTGPVRYIFPNNDAKFLENKGRSTTINGRLLRRAATNNVMFSSELILPPWSMEFDTAMAFTGGSDSDFFMRYVHQGGEIIAVSKAIVSEIVVTDRLKIKWRLQRQHRSSANRVYIHIKLYGYRQTLTSSIVMILGRMFHGSLRLIACPAYLFMGHTNFMCSFYIGLRHFAKATGAITGLLGIHPQPYKVTDGH